MTISFEPQALADLTDWVRLDRKQAIRILELIDAVGRDPFQGIGKPEPLKHNLKGLWSRRIDQEHRLVYWVGKDEVRIVSCRYHYS